MATEGERIEALRVFLQDGIGKEHIDRVLVENDYGAIVNAVDAGLPGDLFCFRVVMEMSKRNCIDDRFFNCLKKERAHRRDEIEKLQRLWSADAIKDAGKEMESPVRAGPRISFEVEMRARKRTSPKLHIESIPDDAGTAATDQFITVNASVGESPILLAVTRKWASREAFSFGDVIRSIQAKLTGAPQSKPRVIVFCERWHADRFETERGLLRALAERDNVRFSFVSVSDRHVVPEPGAGEPESPSRIT